VNIVYKDREIEGERLELVDKDSNYYLGPNLTLRRCTVVTRVSAGWLHIRPTRFIDCTLEVKKELKNMDWLSASLKDCRFKGSLRSCEFGHWPHYADGWENGSIEDCDFTEARLHSCRFHGCDTRTLRFPSWPCFTILDPIRRGPELAAMDWPGDIGSITMKGHAREPPSTVAVTWFAPLLAKQSGTTPEAIKAVIEKCEGIVY
jgi:hypothetical protein